MKKHSNKLSKWEEIMITGQVVASDGTKKAIKDLRAVRKGHLDMTAEKLLLFSFKQHFLHFCFFSSLDTRF